MYVILGIFGLVAGLLILSWYLAQNTPPDPRDP